MKLYKKGMDTSLLKALIGVTVFIVLLFGFLNLAFGIVNSITGGEDSFNRFVNNFDRSLNELEDENIAYFPLVLDEQMTIIGFNPGEETVISKRTRINTEGSPGFGPITDTYIRSASCSDDKTCICYCNDISDRVGVGLQGIEYNEKEHCADGVMTCEEYEAFEFQKGEVVGVNGEFEFQGSTIRLEVNYDGGFVFQRYWNRLPAGQVCLYENNRQESDKKVIGITASVAQCLDNTQ